MPTMDVILPDVMNDWVEKQAKAGHYGTPGDYVLDLIRRDRDRVAALATLDHLIDEGLESGISERSIDDVFASARSEALASRNA